MINKKTKIICTIGPSSAKKEILEKLYYAGMNVARINFSHGTHEENGRTLKLVQNLVAKGYNIATLLDTKGPEIRVGKLENDAISLVEGQKLIISMTEMLGNTNEISVSYQGLFDDVNVNTIIKIDDGKLELKVTEKDAENRKIICEVLNSHVLKSTKSVGIPYAKLNMDFISKKDEKDLKFACDHHMDLIAASFTRRKQDIIDLKAVLKKYSGENIKVIAKIENAEGVENIDEILEVADGVMVARGDLGVEVAFEEVPVIQKILMKKAHQKNKFIIVATQMLESMTNSPAPTRAEVNDVANAVYEGTDAVMLSGETANGKYPVKACETQAIIVKRIEREISYNPKISFDKEHPDHEIEIALDIVKTIKESGSKLVICFTQSESFINKLLHARPSVPVVCITSNDKIFKEYALRFGIYVNKVEHLNNSMNDFENIALQNGELFNLAKDDPIIITDGDYIGGLIYK